MHSIIHVASYNECAIVLCEYRVHKREEERVNREDRGRREGRRRREEGERVKKGNVSFSIHYGS